MLIYESANSTIEVYKSSGDQLYILKTQLHAHAQNEIKMLGQLDHPNIVPLLGWKNFGSKDTIMMPYYLNGDLFDAIYKWPEKMPPLRKMIQQLADIVLYLHERDIVHRDIKPENILFDHENDLILIDFDLAIKMSDYNGNLAGTSEYFPPESNKRRLRCPKKQDVWCIGLVIYEILFKTVKLDPHAWSTFPDPLIQTILSMTLDPNPATRCDIVALVASLPSSI